MNASNATEPVAIILAGVTFGKVAARGPVARLLSAALPFFGRHFEQHFWQVRPILQLSLVPISLVKTTQLFGSLHNVASDVEIAWKDVLLGAFVTALTEVYSRRIGAGARPTERSLLQSPTARSNADSQIDTRVA
jgi:uncharacterized BrkB/YihY/UPF0761 family membrane protein